MRKNLSPKIWGKSGWSFLRNCAEACDDESFPRYKEFLNLLPDVLPCEKCRQHAREYLRLHPPKPGEDLTQWLEEFENTVRARKQDEQVLVQKRRESPAQAWVLTGLILMALVLCLCCVSCLLCLRSVYRARS